MDLRDRLFLGFATRPGFKALAYALCAGLALALGSWPVLALAALPLAADAYGATVLRRTFPSLQEDLLEILEASARRECGIGPQDPAYPILEFGGAVRHWLVRGLPESVLLSLMAPRQDFLVVSRQYGRIFPPLRYTPPTFATEDQGSLDVYYRDITHVEVRDLTMELHTAGGQTIEYEDHAGQAGEAVRHLRECLRAHKTRI